jgi:hypothetical protein
MQPVRADIPLAYVKLIRAHDVFLWRVEHCPLCGGEHTHGGGPLDDDPRKELFHRVKHCIKPVRGEGYILTDAYPSRTAELVAREEARQKAALRKPTGKSPDRSTDTKVPMQARAPLRSTRKAVAERRRR